METGVVRAVGVWFRSAETGRYLYLLRNDSKHPGTWGLPGGKVETGETLLGGMERECIEELGFFPEYQHLVPLEKFTSSDGQFEYNTWVCVVASEFRPQLNHEHAGYAWCNMESFPKPLHQGVKTTLYNRTTRTKIETILQVIS
jgi:8-oxo-dGTP pyrophosphatase MutT (NUDIX family)